MRPSNSLAELLRWQLHFDRPQPGLKIILDGVDCQRPGNRPLPTGLAGCQALINNNVVNTIPPDLLRKPVASFFSLLPKAK
jgi:hypothetical protein